MRIEFDRVFVANQEDCDSMMFIITNKLHFFNLIEVNNTKSENN